MTQFPLLWPSYDSRQVLYFTAVLFDTQTLIS